MLNMFTNTHFGLPSLGRLQRHFGQITNLASDPRVMQFALTLVF
jgi:hypothetical protein